MNRQIDVRRTEEGGWDVKVDGNRLSFVTSVDVKYEQRNFVVTIRRVISSGLDVTESFTNPNFTLTQNLE